MKRKTVREWMEFLGTDNENNFYGIQMEGGLHCKLKNYKPMKEFFETYSGYLDDIVVNAYPKNCHEDGKNYCLFLTEEPINSNKSEREIFEYLFKKAERRDDIHIQENRKDFIEISDRCEDNGIGLIFDKKGNLISVK